MSRTMSHLFLKAAEAGVSVEEYIAAQKILRLQEIELELDEMERMLSLTDQDISDADVEEM